MSPSIMKRAGISLLLLLTFVPGIAAGAGIDIFTRYSPLHPQNNQPITFMITATAPGGISRVRLYLYEYEWQSNGTTVQRRSSGVWGKVKDWSVPGSQNSVTRQQQRTGFPARSFIVYAVTVDTSAGQNRTERWGFTAGDWPLGSTPIPLWVAPDLSGTPVNVLAGTSVVKTNRINVVFIAQQGTGYAQPRDFLPDLNTMIFDGFLRSDAIVQGKQFWAFYYSPEFGAISPYNPAGGNTMTRTAAQIATTNMAANVGAIVHQNSFRDWSDGHFLGTEPGLGNFGTTLHEIGHSIFDLADEYLASNWTSTTPFHNNYGSQAACMSYNFDNHWPVSDAEPISSNFWRPEPAKSNCVMRVSNTVPAVPPHYECSCLKRVQWFYDQLK